MNVPPITVIAKGTFASEPGLNAIAVGNKPKMVVVAVISTGLNRFADPMIIA